MINVLLNGANGKMGSEVIEAISKTEGIQIVCGFDRQETNQNGFPVYNSIDKIMEKVDVIIDFSVPVATFEILKYAKKNKTPIVIATTGFSKEQLEEIKEVSKEIPVFRSSNMSLDINLMASLIQKVAQILTEADIEIVETHHNRKVDAPSGTALLLADSINNELNNEMHYEYDRHVKREKRDKKEIGIHSIRGGNIVGTHTVTFFSENETFEVTHTATSRGVFAEGALKAAEYLVLQNNGLYSMDDLIR